MVCAILEIRGEFLISNKGCAKQFTNDLYNLRNS
jgi:hypothetical protein